MQIGGVPRIIHFYSPSQIFKMKILESHKIKGTARVSANSLEIPAEG